MKKNTALLGALEQPNLVVPRPIRWTRPNLFSSNEERSYSQSPHLTEKQPHVKHSFSFFVASEHSSVESISSTASSPLSIDDLDVLEPIKALTEHLSPTFIRRRCLTEFDGETENDVFENGIVLERVDVQSLSHSPSLFNDSDTVSAEATVPENSLVPAKIKGTLSERFFYYCCMARSHRRVNVLQPSL